jgi:hypothetical protein
MVKAVKIGLIGLAVLAGSIIAPGTAGADQRPPSSIPARDGYLYAWAAAYYQNWPPTHPIHCRWFDADNDWADAPCGLNFRNVASSVYNNSAGNRPVNFYFHDTYKGAWACLAAGDYWDNLQNRTFSWGPGRDGYQKIANDEIASHRWRKAGSPCGDGNP